MELDLPTVLKVLDIVLLIMLAYSLYQTRFAIHKGDIKSVEHHFFYVETIANILILIMVLLFSIELIYSKSISYMNILLVSVFAVFIRQTRKILTTAKNIPVPIDYIDLYFTSVETIGYLLLIFNILGLVVELYYDKTEPQVGMLSKLEESSPELRLRFRRLSEDVMGEREGKKKRRKEVVKEEL